MTPTAAAAVTPSTNNNTSNSTADRKRRKGLMRAALPNSAVWGARMPSASWTSRRMRSEVLGEGFDEFIVTVKNWEETRYFPGGRAFPRPTGIGCMAGWERKRPRDEK